MTVTLELADSPEEVREAVQRFNDEARGWEYASKLAIATKYWVYDAASDMFGPTKFVGFAGIDPARYDVGRAKKSGGTRFDGYVTRRALEAVLQGKFQVDEALTEKLRLWVEMTFDIATVQPAVCAKWRFLTLTTPPSGALTHGSRPDRGAQSGDVRGSESPVNVVGLPYRLAVEDVSAAPRDPFSVDPVAVDRASQAHAVTQNALAAFLLKAGVEPRSPAPGEPDADLLWEHEGAVFVAEVKSTTASNEEKQLRLGLGQVLRYRQLLGEAGHRVAAVLVAERKPSESWLALCDAVSVTLTWPGAFERVVESGGQD